MRKQQLPNNRYFAYILAAWLPLFGFMVAHAAAPMPPCLDGPCNPSNSTPYDLGSVPFPIAWPVPPNTVETVNVTANSHASLAAAVARSNVRVVVPAGTYNGNLSQWGNDVDLVMNNGATVNGSVDFANRQRIRWTGGNVSGSRFNAGGSTSDMLFVDVRILGNGSGTTNENGNNWLGNHSRIAFVHCTIRYVDDQPGTWGLFTLQGRTNSDWIIAGTRIDSTFTAFRLQNIQNVVVVDSAFQSEGLGPTGMRFNAANNVLLRNIVNRGGIHLNYSQDGGAFPDISNLTAIRVDKYSNQSTWAWTASGSTGTVSNSNVYTVGGADGAQASVSPFTGTNNVVRAWNGTDMPSTANIGARR